MSKRYGVIKIDLEPGFVIGIGRKTHTHPRWSPEEFVFLWSALGGQSLEVKKQALSSYLFYREEATHFLDFQDGRGFVENTAQEWTSDEKAIFGTVDVVFEIPSRFGVYVLRIRPGGCIPNHNHTVMEEFEMPLTPGLYCMGYPAVQWKGRFWQKGMYHSYLNPTPREQLVLCVDKPSFDPEDERVGRLCLGMEF
jgi:hypothetical protein